MKSAKRSIEQRQFNIFDFFIFFGSVMMSAQTEDLSSLLSREIMSIAKNILLSLSLSVSFVIRFSAFVSLSLAGRVKGQNDEPKIFKP
jgi:hypothetical protein